MNKKLKPLFTRSSWVLASVFFGILTTIFVVGNPLANKYEAAINGMFHTNPYVQIDTSGSETDSEYFKSDFMKNGSYDDEAMRANSKEKALQAAVEGSVVLQNNDALPLKENAGVSLFGISSANYVFLGDGSGSMSVTPDGTMNTAFSEYNLRLNMDLFFQYSSLAQTYKRTNRQAVNEAPYSEVSSTVDKTISNYNDAAVMIISRVAGEHYDITPSDKDDFADEKNYLDLTNDEIDVLTNLIKLRDEGKVKKVVVLINSANALQFKNLSKLNVDGIVYVGLGGTMSYKQIAAVLSGRGDYVVSGHLSDTFVYDNDSIPSQQNFGDFTWNEYSSELPDLDNQGKETYASYNIKYVTYQEGIYVGYRYYETRYEDTILNQGQASGSKGATTGATWAYENEVSYPFGYGLSYTEFERSDYKMTELPNGNYQLSFTTTNVGDYAGKDVMQVYLQKPYTEYDKEHNIEKASVELVGFAKSKKLEKGESATVTVEVDPYEFKTYDAYGEGSYILEKGDYYLTMASDAHEAINNIIVEKDDSLKDDIVGSYVDGATYKVTVDKDDFTTYKTSPYTNKEITNQFNDTDLNLYEGTKDDQSITYLSRNNWNDTFPEPVVLDCVNDIMVHDMQYGDEVIANPEDEMPIYDTVTSSLGELKLIMLKDKDYDDELWDDLLNQMSKGEQEYLMSYGLHHIAGASSVSAPGAECKDGPAGLKENNPTLKTQMSFPSETLMAATFNAPLLEEVGEAFSHEILHAGYTGIYGPGGCIHRSPYGGRNWEYFSEDGFLSGKLLASEIKGLQSKGVIVFTKHFALNDQETNRYGVATFANEQSIREIYLKPFEMAVTEGKMNGLMSSFNRIGTTWAGAHHGLLTSVLRDEWGFNGIVETDSCTGTTDSVHHMTNPNAKAEGLLAGNDLWMDGGGNESYLKEYEDNPTVMLALREACHRILYAQLNSNCMNGVTQDTSIQKVAVWWQVALNVGEGVSITLLTLCLLMAIASFILNSKKISEKVFTDGKSKTVTSDDGGSNGGTTPPDNDGNNKKKKILLFSLLGLGVVATVVLSLTLPLASSSSSSQSSSGSNPTTSDSSGSSEEEKHVCTEKCPICGGCLDLECDDEACSVKCGEGLTSHEFEAEDGLIVTGKERPQIYTTNGITYIGELNNNLGGGVTFTIKSAADTTASLVVRINKRVVETIYTNNVYVSVNGSAFTSQAVVKSNGLDGETWTTFSDVNLGCINLVEGENTISLIQQGTGNTSGYNLDKIKLLTDTDLEYVAPIIECDEICPVCGRCMDLECTNPGHEEKCQVAGEKFVFQAEKSTLSGGTKGMPSTGEQSSVYEGTDKYVLVGNLSENLGAKLTFNIYSKDNVRANLAAAVTSRPDEKRFMNAFDVELNGEVLDRESRIKASDPNSPTIRADGNDWFTSREVNLGCVDLVKGLNTLTFTVKTSSNADLVNFDYIAVTSPAELSDDVFEDAVLSGIEVVSQPSKTSYFVGEEFDATGMKVEAVYSDGSRKEITDYTYEPTGALTLENNVITVKYGEFTDEVSITISEKPKNTYRFEAEDATLIDGVKALSPNNTLGYVGSISENMGAKISFNVNSKNTAKATLILSVGQRIKEYKISDLFKITVNDQEVTTTAVNKASIYQYDLWYGFTEITIGNITLAPGANTITLEVISNDGSIGVNMDYIKLVTDGEITSDYPEHTCESKCPICGGCLDDDCDYSECEVKCGDNKAYNYRYEAESAEFGAGNSKMPSIRDNFVQDVNGNAGATLTFKVDSSADQVATLAAAVSMKRDQKPLFTDLFQITVNGESVTSPARVDMPISNVDTWHYFSETLIGCINLKAGENTIVLTATNNATNIDYITLKTDEELTNNEGCTHKCSVCGKCLDPDCQATSCLDKCGEDTIGHDHIFNAVDAELTNGAKNFSTTEQSGALGNVDQNKGATITFRVNAGKAGTVNLLLSFNYRDQRRLITSGMSINVNGVDMVSSAMRPASPLNNSHWNTFVEINLGCVELKEGENVIVLTVLTDKDRDNSNLMYLNLRGDNNITWSEQN